MIPTVTAPLVSGVSIHGLRPEHITVHVEGSWTVWATLGPGVATIHGTGDNVTAQLENLEAIGAALAGQARALRAQITRAEVEPA